MREVFLIYAGQIVGYAAYEPGADGKLKYLLVRDPQENEHPASSAELDMSICDLIRSLGYTEKL